MKRTDREQVQCASNVLEGLRDDALRISEDLEVDRLIDNNSGPTLVNAIENSVNIKTYQGARYRVPYLCGARPPTRQI